MIIPKTLDEAIQKLEELFSQKEKDFITSNPESAMAQYHFRAGMWMRNNWGFGPKKTTN